MQDCQDTRALTHALSPFVKKAGISRQWPEVCDLCHLYTASQGHDWVAASISIKFLNQVYQTKKHVDGESGWLIQPSTARKGPNLKIHFSRHDQAGANGVVCV